MATTSYYAKFYEISNEINPEYINTGYITREMAKGLDNRVNKYINTQNFKSGDILFVGSTYETRQEYGFYLVLDGKGINSESILDSILTTKILDELKKNNVKYEKLFLQVNKKNDWIQEMFQYMFQDYDYIERFREEGIY